MKGNLWILALKKKELGKLLQVCKSLSLPLPTFPSRPVFAIFHFPTLLWSKCELQSSPSCAWNLAGHLVANKAYRKSLERRWRENVFQSFLPPRRDWTSYKTYLLSTISILFFFYIYWTIVDSQCCISFQCTAKWISYTYTYIHSFLDSFPI